MRDIFSLMMCAHRRGNHPLFCYTNRDVLRKIFSFLHPADWTDDAREEQAVVAAEQGAKKRRRKLSTALEPQNPTWVHTAVADFKANLQKQFQAKETAKSELANWDQSVKKLHHNVDFWQTTMERDVAHFQAEIQKLQDRIVQTTQLHQKLIAENNHLIATSDARRIAQTELAEKSERAFQQQFAPFLQKYTNHL
jgi:hypothetical protein